MHHQVLLIIYPLKWFNYEIPFFIVLCTVIFHRRSLFSFLLQYLPRFLIILADIHDFKHYSSFVYHLSSQIIFTLKYFCINYFLLSYPICVVSILSYNCFRKFSIAWKDIKVSFWQQFAETFKSDCLTEAYTGIVKLTSPTNLNSEVCLYGCISTVHLVYGVVAIQESMMKCIMYRTISNEIISTSTENWRVLKLDIGNCHEFSHKTHWFSPGISQTQGYRLFAPCW